MEKNLYFSAYSSLILAFVLVFYPEILAAQTGIVQGRVTDAQTGVPLPAANLLVVGTTKGAASDLEGYYQILNAPVGRCQLVCRFIGYKAETAEVVVYPGQKVTLDFALRTVVVKGETVVVIAQYEGQVRAINQQLVSERIVNVVASDRIQELPDQNAAESVGRLPGVAIQRSSGEGQKILIRGLEPKYSTIMVNGQRIPSTDEKDRSVDLSMISPDVLEGIEITKTLTPDQDGDAIGGVVNFTRRQADPGFMMRLNAQGGYNHIRDSFRNYRFNGTVGNRFFI